ncbi:response regulator [Pontibacter cellulosilyticus]|uniref:Response regulator n=1 Tax=Pontibacter cellulosilyticus TaxID=1720253 RepID=A0A923NBH9_9BACT|nr:response regulator [Pontibacter cellulosilyticus]MBC5994861.1 response regulator [Pontibacter cellulosilyticus]
MSLNERPLVLLADDDAEDRMLICEAMEEANAASDIKFVENGEELMDYLLNQGRFEDKQEFPAPSIILLDLNMPKKDGREALLEIKQHQHLRFIPVIILTTSSAEEDVIRTYQLGVNSYITKPTSFTSLVDLLATITKYWLEIVKLPSNCLSSSVHKFSVADKA